MLLPVYSITPFHHKSLDHPDAKCLVCGIMLDFNQLQHPVTTVLTTFLFVYE